MIYFSLILAIIIFSNFLSAFYTLHFSPLPSSSTPNPTPLPDNFQPTTHSGFSATQFTYPNATQTNINDNTFTSNDDVNVITNWYKQAIKDSGLNITSVIQTNSNGNILNRLTGISGGKEVDIEISKTSNQSETKIGLYVK